MPTNPNKPVTHGELEALLQEHAPAADIARLERIAERLARSVSKHEPFHGPGCQSRKDAEEFFNELMGRLPLLSPDGSKLGTAVLDAWGNVDSIAL